MASREEFEVVVVGAGHAGCEAAHAAARMGLRTALVTMNADLIAQMSCNPAVGGIAKGHLVREIDALGGLMGRLTDEIGIQFRLLNTSRGPAVWSPRAQCDKQRYRQQMRELLEEVPNLFLRQAEVTELIVEEEQGKRRCCGVRLRDGRSIAARAVIVTTGTFLNGLIHCGEQQYPAGRNGEPASEMLGENLKTLGLRGIRLKTGTPPRLDGRTIDFSRLEPQHGDADPEPFSFQTARIARPQIDCYIVHTTEVTHEIIRRNVHRSPMYSGQIHSIGPRYCPSIEDKIVKFPDKSSHQLYLEPEGLDTHEIYVNGLSTSLPYEVQVEILSSVKGLENVDMLRPGYAIEYDAIDPTELCNTLKTKKIDDLYLAGQINGTSGYEEAACQGLIAGINAALVIQEKEPLVLARSEAYTGILIDDLISKGINEPYRMFTSRAEFRLKLRIDNADSRLTPHGHRVGLIDEARWQSFQQKQQRMKKMRDLLEKTRVERGSELTETLGDVTGSTLAQLLRRPEVGIESLLPSIKEDSEALRLEIEAPSEEDRQAIYRRELKSVETQLKYAGYFQQQDKVIARLQRAGARPIPEDFDYSAISGLSREMKEKLTKVRPATVGQAGRIPGVTPAALSLIDVFLELRARAAREENKSAE